MRTFIQEFFLKKFKIRTKNIILRKACFANLDHTLLHTREYMS